MYICVPCSVHDTRSHHTRDACTLPRSLPPASDPHAQLPMAPLFSTLFLIQNKWSQERTGWRGGGREGEGKRQIKEKKSRALSPWPSIRSLKKRERGRKEGLWANSSSPLLQSISGQKKYTITRQEEAKIYGPETSPLTSNHLTPFCSSRSLSLSHSTAFPLLFFPPSTPPNTYNDVLSPPTVLQVH